MGFSVEDDNQINRFIDNIKKGVAIEVGAWGDMALIANSHEFGATIKPKHGKYLTIPIHARAKGRRVSDFPNLVRNWKRGGKPGKLLGVREGDVFTPYFVLTEKVVIPERSFLRSTLDEELNDIADKVGDLTVRCANEGVPLQTLSDAIALELRGKVQNKMRDIRTPANTPLTSKMKGSNNPLIDSGHLLRSIEYKVKGGGVE